MTLHQRIWLRRASHRLNVLLEWEDDGFGDCYAETRIAVLQEVAEFVKGLLLELRAEEAQQSTASTTVESARPTPASSPGVQQWVGPQR